MRTTLKLSVLAAVALALLPNRAVEAHANDLVIDAAPHGLAESALQHAA